MPYLDTSGLTRFWNKIKTYVGSYHDSTKQDVITSSTDLVVNQLAFSQLYDAAQSHLLAEYSDSTDEWYLGNSEAPINATVAGAFYVPQVDSSGAGDQAATKDYVDNHHDSTKQDTLTAGSNIQISGTTISATDTTYTAATAAPLMDGTAAVGTSAKYAREDHVHPSDTAKADASALTAEVTTRKSQVSAIERVLEKGFGKQIRYIDAKASGILYVEDVDTDTDWSKDVQSKVLPLAAVDMVGGKTVVWNQMVDSSTSSVTVTSGHVYISYIGGTWSRATSSGAAIAVTGGTDCIFDLTAMFGSGNEPSTVAEFRAMFPADYYAYSANTLMSADVVNIKSVGKNLWQGAAEYTSTAYSKTFYSGTDVVDAFNLLPRDTTLTWSCYVTATGASGGWTTPIIKYTDGTSTNIGSAAYGAVSRQFTIPSGKTISYVVFYMGAGNTDGSYTNIQVEKGSAATSYSEYQTHSLAIPSAARALCPLYGASAGSVYNYIDWDNQKYVQSVGSRVYQSGDESDASVVTDGTTTYYELATPVEVDLSDVLTADNFIEVEAGGTLTMENSHGDNYRIPVPNTETFEIDVNA